jgi:hypothetical protein
MSRMPETMSCVSARGSRKNHVFGPGDTCVWCGAARGFRVRNDGSRVVSVRLSPHEASLVAKTLRLSGETVSDFMHRAVLGHISRETS